MVDKASVQQSGVTQIFCFFQLCESRQYWILAAISPLLDLEQSWFTLTVLMIQHHTFFCSAELIPMIYYFPTRGCSIFLSPGTFHVSFQTICIESEIFFCLHWSSNSVTPVGRWWNLQVCSILPQLDRMLAAFWLITLSLYMVALVQLMCSGRSTLFLISGLPYFLRSINCRVRFLRNDGAMVVWLYERLDLIRVCRKACTCLVALVLKRFVHSADCLIHVCIIFCRVPCSVTLGVSIWIWFNLFANLLQKNQSPRLVLKF
jgi:hypothetical protein